MAGGIGRLQKSIYDGNEAFGKLGLKLSDLKRLSPIDAMQRVGDAIGNLKSPTDRTKAAMDLFGKSGAKLLQVFNDKEGSRIRRENPRQHAGGVGEKRRCIRSAR